MLLLGVFAGCKDTTNDGPAPRPRVERVEFSGDDTVSLRVIGTGFVPSSVVRYAPLDLRTTFVSGTELRATISADSLPSSFQGVFVFSPPPGGGQSSSDSVQYVRPADPRPVVASLAPDTVSQFAENGTLRLTGSGFTRRLLVLYANGQVAGSRRVSPSELQITIPSSRTRTAVRDTVYLFGSFATEPRLGVPIIYEVRAPRPVITGLRQATTAAGQPEFTIQIDGSGFLDSTVVTIDDSARTVRRVAPGTFELTLTEADLWRPRTLQIALTNAGPGGGRSADVPFVITRAVPRLAVLPSNGGQVNRGFTMTVHGTGFTPGAAVQWNGVDLPTTYVSSSRLRGIVSGALMGSVGTNTIAVRNPLSEPALSSSLPFTVRSVGATGSRVREMNVGGVDLVWLPLRERLYASVDGGVIEIDPLTATVARFVATSASTRLALADDGSQLYVMGPPRDVHRIDMSAFVRAATVTIPTDLRLGDIAVLPGQPMSIAVAAGAGPAVGTAPTVYDNGIPRGAGQYWFGGRIAFAGDATRAYIYDNLTTGFSLQSIAIGANGATLIRSNSGFFEGFDTDIFGANGRVYGTDGAVVDPERSELLGRFGSGMYSVLVDAALGRAFVLYQGRIAVHDLNDFGLIGTVSFTATQDVPGGPFGNPRPSMSRCGADCIAWVDGKRLVLVNSPIFAP